MEANSEECHTVVSKVEPVSFKQNKETPTLLQYEMAT
jgi:hypothetical protein